LLFGRENRADFGLGVNVDGGAEGDCESDCDCDCESDCKSDFNCKSESRKNNLILRRFQCKEAVNGYEQTY
jgi:hypothetical protein